MIWNLTKHFRRKWRKLRAKTAC